MTSAVFSPDIADSLFHTTERRKARSALGWLAALSVHAAMIGLVSGAAVQARPELPPVEVEILPPEPAPVKAPEPPPVEEAAPATAPSVARSAPAAARAGALVTAKADAPQAQQADAPLDFTTDPNGTTYGGGVVAVGGHADFGEKGAQLGGKGAQPAVQAPVVRDGGETLVPLADLSRKPQLGEADPCRGYFPRAATDDDAQVSLRVVIGKSGQITSALLLSENPPGQGFGAAAKACLLQKRLSPALDRDGQPAATATRINIRFTR